VGKPRMAKSTRLDPKRTERGGRESPPAA
jgi:hypothetical protein